MPATADARAGRAAFTHPGFVLFQIARFLIVAAVEMQAVAVGWQVYEITKRPLDLGYVGLAPFLLASLFFSISRAASCWLLRAGAVSSGDSVVSDFRARFGSFRTAQRALGLLCGIRGLLCLVA